MPRRPSINPPAYSLHKASGRAVTRINGRDIYLGKHGSPESHEAYERAIAEWRAACQAQIQRELEPITPHAKLTVNEVLLAYAQFASNYYVNEDGSKSKEYVEMMISLRPIRRLYGRTLMSTLGPKSLKTIQTAMVNGETLCRNVINRRINRIRRFIKWAVSEELAPPNLHAAAKTVQPLRVGQFGVRESDPVKPVAVEDVMPIVRIASPPVAAMIQLQLLGGMRPGEVVGMRAVDICQNSDVWLYQPDQHKNRWRGKARRTPIGLGPKSQEILQPFLSRDEEKWLFSPREAEAWRNQQRRASRKSKMTPSQARRQPKSHPKRAKREFYDVDSYRKAVHYAIKKLNEQRAQDGLALIPHWSPAQLRHSRGTDIRQRYGIEAAQVFLGHEHADVTQIYAERDLRWLEKIALETG